MRTLGIIGFGSFGQFMAEHLKNHFEIIVYDVTEVTDARSGSLEEVAGCDVVIPSVPVQEFGGTLESIKKLLKPGALVMDVCSVKEHPAQQMLEILPEHVELVASHPLFGPKSGRNGIDGLTIAICNLRASDETFDSVGTFLEELGLNVVRTTPEDHDKQMAYVQVLTHFIGRALNEMDLDNFELRTKTFDHLMELKDILSLDSEELFLAIQKENPFAEEVRQEFLAKLSDLDRLASD